MMLTIYGLPPKTKYREVKALIRQECNLIDFILDNLVDDGDNSKKVRLGLSDDNDGYRLIKNLDGFRMSATHILKVVPFGKSNQYDDRSNYENQSRNDYQNPRNEYQNQPAKTFGNQSHPLGNQGHPLGNQSHPIGNQGHPPVNQSHPTRNQGPAGNQVPRQFPDSRNTAPEPRNFGQSRPDVTPSHSMQGMNPQNRPDFNDRPDFHGRPDSSNYQARHDSGQYHARADTGPYGRDSRFESKPEPRSDTDINMQRAQGYPGSRIDVLQTRAHGVPERVSGPEPGRAQQWGANVPPNQPFKDIPNSVQNNYNMQQRPNMNTGFNQQPVMGSTSFPQSRPLDTPYGFPNKPKISEHMSSRGALRPVDLIDTSVHQTPQAPHYTHDKPVTIKKDNFQGPGQYNIPQTPNPMNQPWAAQPNQQKPYDKPYEDRRFSDKQTQPKPQIEDYDKRTFDARPGRNTSPGRGYPEKFPGSYEKGRNFPEKSYPTMDRRMSPLRRDTSPKRMSPGRRFSLEKRLSSPGRRPLSPGRRLMSPGRRPGSPSRRPISPGRRPGSPGRRPISPGRRQISPGRRQISPGRRQLSPGRRQISPSGRRQLSPGRRPISPGRRPLSPSRRPISPGRRPLSPGRRQLSPGRRPISPGRRPISPGRRPLSPGRRQMSPTRRAISPGRRPISPGRRPLSPGRRQLSPERRQISPGRRALSPGRRPISPSRRPISPSRRQTSPDRAALFANRREMSPGRRQLSPDLRQMSPGRRIETRRLSPSDRRMTNVRDEINRHYSPHNTMSPTRRIDADPQRPRFSPRRQIDVSDKQIEDKMKPIRPAYEPQAQNQYSSGYRGGSREESQYSRRPSPWDKERSPRSPRRSWAQERRRSPSPREPPPPPAWPIHDATLSTDIDREFQDVYQRAVEFRRKAEEMRKSGDKRRPDREREEIPDRSERERMDRPDREDRERMERPDRIDRERMERPDGNDRERMERFERIDRDRAERPDRIDRERVERLDRPDRERAERPSPRRNELCEGKLGDRRKIFLPANVRVKRDRAGEEIVSKIVDRYELKGEMKARVAEELKLNVANVLYDMFGDRDVSFIELVIKYQSKFSSKEEDKMLHDVMASMPASYRAALKRHNNQDKPEVPAKVSRFSDANPVEESDRNESSDCMRQDSSNSRMVIKLKPLEKKSKLTPAPAPLFVQTFHEIPEDEVCQPAQLDKLQEQSRQLKQLQEQEETKQKIQEFIKNQSQKTQLGQLQQLHDLQLQMQQYQMQQEIPLNDMQVQQLLQANYQALQSNQFDQVQSSLVMPQMAPDQTQAEQYQTTTQPFVPSTLDPAPMDFDQNENVFKLFICQDEFDAFSEIQAECLKNFIVSKIIQFSESNPGWAPDFTLKGLQNKFRYELTTADEMSKNWLLNLDFSEFNYFNVLVYTKEELWYERAAIWLPGHSRSKIQPFVKLCLQNRHLKNININKWKFVKKIVTLKGTRLYVDMPPADARALESSKMMLSYELTKVNVFLKAVAVDKNSFDAGLKEYSITDPAQLITAVQNCAMPSLNANHEANLVKITLNGAKTLTLEQARKIKEIVIYNIFKYHEQGGKYKTDFLKYGFCAPNYFAIVPENKESKRWLLARHFGKLNRQTVVVVGGDEDYFTMYAHIPNECNHNKSLILERLRQSNQGIKGLNFHKWKIVKLTIHERRGFHVIFEIDMESLCNLSKTKYQLDYVTEFETEIIEIKSEYSIAKLEEKLKKYKSEQTDIYDVANMDIDSDEDDDVIYLG